MTDGNLQRLFSPARIGRLNLAHQPHTPASHTGWCMRR